MDALDRNAVLLGVASAIVAIDQLTKALVTNRLAPGRRYAFAPGVGVVRLAGDGARFVSLSSRQALAVWLAVVTALEALVALGAPLETAALAGLGLAVGGATGNLIDRTVRGVVVDFISVGRWPTFNVADVALVCGVGVAAWSVL